MDIPYTLVTFEALEVMNRVALNDIEDDYGLVVLIGHPTTLLTRKFSSGYGISDIQILTCSTVLPPYVVHLSRLGKPEPPSGGLESGSTAIASWTSRAIEHILSSGGVKLYWASTTTVSGEMIDLVQDLVQELFSLRSDWCGALFLLTTQRPRLVVDNTPLRAYDMPICICDFADL